MAISGSASFYMQRGMAGPGFGAHSGLNMPSGVNALASTTMPFQSNIGPSTLGSTLPMEPSTPMLPHGVHVGTTSAVPLAGEPVKRKRCRPRKYGPEGSVSLALSPAVSTHPSTITSTQKRGRGRPPGTGKKQQLASLGKRLSGSAGIGFAPNIVTVAVGKGPRATCILSANGAVSAVTLRQPRQASGGTVTYEISVLVLFPFLLIGLSFTIGCISFYWGNAIYEKRQIFAHCLHTNLCSGGHCAQLTGIKYYPS